MAINPASTPTSSSALSTTIVLNVPTSPATNDFMYAQVGWSGGTGVAITPPAGWTLIRRVDSTTVVGLATYYRIAGSSEPGSYTWTLDISVQNSGQMDLYRSDAGGVLSLDVENGQSNASSANVDAPSITTTVTNTLLVFGGGVAGAVTFTPPTGFTERTDVNSGTIAYKNQSASGATGTVTATASVAGLNIGFLIAIKEALPQTLTLSAVPYRAAVNTLITVNAAAALAASDISVGSWTTDAGGTTNLYQAIDETSVNDADYIQSPLNPNASAVEVKFSSLTDPALAYGHLVIYRIAKPAGSYQMNLTVRLKQGASVIATWTHINISETLTTITQTLSDAEANSISDYSDLRLNFEGTQV